MVLKVVDGCYEASNSRFFFVTARCNPVLRTNTRVGYHDEPSKIGRRRIIVERQGLDEQVDRVEPRSVPVESVKRAERVRTSGKRNGVGGAEVALVAVWGLPIMGSSGSPERNMLSRPQSNRNCECKAAVVNERHAADESRVEEARDYKSFPDPHFGRSFRIDKPIRKPTRQDGRNRHCLCQAH